MEQMPFITLAQCQAAMAAMLEEAQKKSELPVAMAIVDNHGMLINYQEMDRLRLFTRRHAIRKAYTAAITGMNSARFAEINRARDLGIRELGGDLQLTPGIGGVVVRSSIHDQDDFHTNVMGGIGVGGYFSGKEDEELAMIGLKAMSV